MLGAPPDMDEEPELISSALDRAVTRGDLTVHIFIYRYETDDTWVLEVEDHLGGSTVWDERFPTDQAALDEALTAIDEDGIESFTVPADAGISTRVDPQLGLFADPLQDGSALWAFPCTAAKCACRDVLLVTAPSRDALLERVQPVADAWARGESYREAAAQLEGVTSFVVDIDSGELIEGSAELREGGAEGDGGAPDVQHVWEQVRGVHLDEFAVLFHLCKGEHLPVSPLESGGPIVIEDLQSGERILWDDVGGPLRTDLYLDSSGGASAHEWYCPAPRCDCDEVVVDFADLDTDDLKPVGAVTYNFTSGKTTLEPERPAERQRLDELWQLFCRRYPNKDERFRGRRRDLAAAFDRIVGVQETPVASIKVPRNALCPCGSGKKYKKCCGRN